MSEHLITITTQDAQQIQFNCAIEEDIISAAERQNIILPQQCRNGVCGFCTASNVRGQYILRDYNAAALTDYQAANKHTLLCRTYPQTDLIVETNYNYAAIKFGQIPQAFHSVIAAEMVNPTVLHLILQEIPTANELLSTQLLAGQYVQLSIPEQSIHRAYSVANSMNWEGRLEFYIRLYNNGQFSNLLNQLQIGDKLLIKGPHGEFVLKERGLKPRYFIAGGTGLAPILAMLKYMAELGEPHPIQLFFGVRHESDLFAQDVIAELQSALPKLKYHCYLSQSGVNWNGYCGSIVNAVGEAFTQLKTEPDIYVCGSKRLVDAVLELAAKFAIAYDNIIYEKFD